ncbi:hypothetical protein LLEC1_04048 [Akanthomyces lecanii]|uniref:BZIP domain-containing protein n=1 Tax=Cordyceps confragosa TaxID=2714763 RepID=A0A179I3X6_CORDF|nr:hypothetical protein LLEC1_04048 [Akanthomyces lecanii]
MSKFANSDRGSSASATQKDPSPPPVDDLLYLSSAGWVAGLSLTSPYTSSTSLSLAPSSQSTSQPTSLTPHSQPTQHNLFPDMPVPTFEHGHYMTMNSQLPWSSESLMVPPLHHDVSSQGSSAEERFLSESPSFNDAEGEADTPSAEIAEEPKKPKRSRPNRYKNAPPAVIQRRRAANRKSQRAYRKRKDDRIAELEELLGEATRREQQVSQAYATLRAEFEQLLMIGSPESTSHNGRSPSVASPVPQIAATATATTATQLDEDEAVASTFLALAAFSQQNGGGVSPQLAHMQQPQATSSQHLLSVYPPPPM